MLEILHLCPAGIATGGTEGIHHLVSELNKDSNIHARIFYKGKAEKPQPAVYTSYNVDYTLEMPKNFKGLVIFPEVWANQILDSEYRDCAVAVNWQGIDVYNWHTPLHQRGLYLKRRDAIHITMSEYGMRCLGRLKLDPIKVPDCINEKYFEAYTEPSERKDVVLYNPTRAKMTQFQEMVMARCRTELGVKFQPLEGYSQEQLIDLMRHSKLYIDFGAFSGRERLPREAVMCGCCILTSNQGTARYYEDNSILDKYKPETVDDAIRMVKYVLRNYTQCRPDFEPYRQALREDLRSYPERVKELCNAFLNHCTGA